jgi:hypothetical protein
MRSWIPRTRPASSAKPGPPPLLYKEWGKADKAFEHLETALSVRKDADPDHVRAKRTRETLEAWRRSA